MRKQNVLTILGIALSFVIAIGGWAVTSMLIDLKSDALLSAGGLTPVYAPAATSSGHTKLDDNPNIMGEDISGERSIFSAIEISRILSNWESRANEQPHEPMEGQITMEQAIAIGQKGLSYFYDQGIIPAQLLEYSKTDAYLCQRQPSGGAGKMLSPDYSYWGLSFSGENGSVRFSINAMTGQIWKADLGINSSETVLTEAVKKIKAEQMLDVFTAYLGLTGSGSYSTDGLTASESFADGMLYAVARSISLNSISEGEINTNRYSMAVYLSAHSPTIG
ncbi:MAG: hypothetical protein LBL15_00620 [Oscillospiraceae bacterium]|nr:hypothetical protein [Oscillospiraceae bacterium]